MHISDGILDPKICIGGYVIAACLAGAALKKVKQEDITKISVMGAAFFVSSLIHFKVGFSSVHLTLIGLVGIVLGIHSSLAIITGLFFQAVMFNHGGLSTLGVNAVIFSVPALIVYVIFNMVYKRVRSPTILGVFAGICAGAAIVLALLSVMALLYFSGEELLGFAYFFSLSNGVLALVEGVVTALAIIQICKVKPQMLQSFRQ
jgi:cobalt/nickel transport system permease protein